MEDSDSARKYPVPLGIGGSRIGSEISHLNDVEKTLDAIYKPHDQIEEYPDDEEEKIPYRAHTDGHEEYSVDQGLDGIGGQSRKKATTKLGSISMKQHLPQLKLNVPLALTTNEVFETFVNISKKQNFQVIEMEQTIATAVNKEPFSLKKMFLRCIPFSDMKREQPNDTFISAIRLQLSINDVKACRKICLKGLYGENQRLQEFVNVFKQRITERVQLLPSTSKKSLSGRQPGVSSILQGHKKNSSTFKSLNQMSKHTIRPNDSDDEDHEQKESAELLPQPVKIKVQNIQTEGIMSIVNETVYAFNSEYNLGKESAKSLIHYCRPAVEKYIFSKNEEEDKLFNERSAQIKKMRPSDVMAYLGIKNQFIINEPLNFSSRISYATEYNHKPQPVRLDSDGLFKQADTSLQFESQRSEGNHTAEHQIIFQNTSHTSSINIEAMNQKHDQPYSEAIKCIEKIQQFTSPRDKLACLSESFGCMKTAIVDYWKGKIELNTMDDVLPLTIYAVSMANLSHPASEFNLLDDYLRINDKGYDFERKLLTNFDGSIRYINHEWELDEQ